MPRLDLTLGNSLDEVGRMLDELESFGQRCAIAEAVVMQLGLCLDELVTNIVSYGWDEPGEHMITVSLDIDDQRVLRAELIDDGRPFDPLERETPDLEQPLDQRPIGGLGIHLVRVFTDQVAYCRADGRNRLTLVRALDDAASP